MSSADNILVVDSEEQAGARASLAGKPVVHIGSAYDNDIVLRSHAMVQLALHRISGGWNLESLSGDISVAGKPVASGQVMRLKSNEPVMLGSASFHIEPAVKKEEPSAAARKSPVLRKKPKRSYATLALLAGISALAYLGIHDQWQLRAGSVEQTWTIHELLQADGLENVSVTGDVASGFQLHGRVATRNALSELRQSVSASGHSSMLDVQVDADLQNAVQDVFRTHGVDADIAVDGRGSVLIQTQTRDTQKLEAIEAVLAADLPFLTSSKIENSMPVDVAEAAPVPAIDPEKAVETVVDGPTAYVITRDQARYFVGAVLPSGHTITDIKDSTVFMVKAGVETQLIF